jgi:pyruvate kinase
MSQTDVPSDLHTLEGQIAALAADVRRGQRVRLATWRARIVGSPYRGSATNLAAYLTFRHHDIRDIQDQLSVLGLSSLGRTEAHVRAGIAAVQAALIALQGDAASLSKLARIARLRAAQGRLLTDHAALLLGPEPADRRTRIMVTMPAEAAADPHVVRDLIDRGMDLARINGAHDGPETWRALAREVRSASRESGRPCRILLDLPGPKLRIARLPGAPGRLHLRSPRNGRGPTRLILDGGGARGTSQPEDGTEPRIVVDPAWLEHLRSGDRISCVDGRGRDRVLKVDGRTPSGAVRASTVRGLVLVEGTVLHHARRHGGKAATKVGPFEPGPGKITVRVGDRVRFVADGPSEPDRSSTHGADDPWIACAEPGVLEGLEVGHGVIIDDGHIVTKVEVVDGDGALLRVSSTRRPEERLREDQGLNFPDSPIRGHGFGADDLLALDVAAEIADIVGLSFAQGPEDVDRLIAELDARGAPDIGVIAKIETQEGIEQLPQIIVAGASRRPFGVMIARGDLAVEIGYERTAEMQEEILWLCEAAHVPVVWATQVLESLVKTGIPTRAELTDAAMAQRAECVMLNKGPHILDGVDTLVDVIGRMRTHQSKKSPRLRALGSW